MTMKLYNIVLRQYRTKKVLNFNVSINGKTIKDVNEHTEQFLRENQDHSEINQNKTWYIITSKTKVSKTTLLSYYLINHRVD